MKKLILLLLLTTFFSCNNSTKEKKQEQEKKQKQEKKQEQKLYYINSKGGLNVRDMPSSDGKKIATLIKNDLIFYITKTGKSLTINDTDDLTGEIKEVSGNWVKIKTYNPPKLKGDKILWEDNTENVEGYVFDGFLNKLETSIEDHFQGKFYTKKQLSLLKQVEGLWISNNAYDSTKICDPETKSFYSIEPLLNYKNEDEFYINGKWYVYMYGSRFAVESIEQNSANIFIIGGFGIGKYEEESYYDELILRFNGNELQIDNKPYSDSYTDSCNKCKKNETTGEYEVWNGQEYQSSTKYVSESSEKSDAKKAEQYLSNGSWTCTQVLSGTAPFMRGASFKFSNGVLTVSTGGTTVNNFYEITSTLPDYPEGSMFSSTITVNDKNKELFSAITNKIMVLSWGNETAKLQLQKGY